MLSKPDIIISQEDSDFLYELLDRLPRTSANDRLFDELDRAETVARDKLPNNVVSMRSKVTFTVMATAKTFTRKLVYPHDTADENTISILTPVGSALLGLSVGQNIEWPLENNKSTMVCIDAIDNT